MVCVSTTYDVGRSVHGSTTAQLMVSIVDHGIMTKDLSHIYSNGLTMLGVAFIGQIGGVGCTVFSSIASLNFGNDLRISPTLTLVVTVPLLVVILYGLIRLSFPLF
ncbi:hypothetical protein [Paenibacillus sp.]|uniref:hypothetical protein n=1 Tax=Paenibacillus sp. TaxID=58172 RepID=UPI0028AE7604|nr:hypothetical protein [Paenibacillus sp.]